jgi:hypothetical protein
MGIESARWVSSSELRSARARTDKAWRVSATGESVGQAQPPVDLSVVKPVGPRQAAQDGATRVLGSMLADRKQFAQLVRTMRHTHPSETAHMSDEQIARFARNIYTERIRESTTRAFTKMGRGNELIVRASG